MMTDTQFNHLCNNIFICIFNQFLGIIHMLIMISCMLFFVTGFLLINISHFIENKRKENSQQAIYKKNTDIIQNTIEEIYLKLANSFTMVNKSFNDINIKEESTEEDGDMEESTEEEDEEENEEEDEEEDEEKDEEEDEEEDEEKDEEEDEEKDEVEDEEEDTETGTDSDSDYKETTEDDTEDDVIDVTDEYLKNKENDIPVIDLSKEEEDTKENDTKENDTKEEDTKEEDNNDT